MSLGSDYGPLLALGAGVVLLGMASKRKPRRLEDRSGEACDPDGVTPFGYQCGQNGDDWELQEERNRFTGYGPYINQSAMDQALEVVGFPNGDLLGFQQHSNDVHGQDVPVAGAIDRASMLFLREAEMMLARGEWIFPELA